MSKIFFSHFGKCPKFSSQKKTGQEGLCGMLMYIDRENATLIYLSSLLKTVSNTFITNFDRNSETLLTLSSP